MGVSPARWLFVIGGGEQNEIRREGLKNYKGTPVFRIGMKKLKGMHTKVRQPGRGEGVSAVRGTLGGKKATFVSTGRN